MTVAVGSVNFFRGGNDGPKGAILVKSLTEAYQSVPIIYPDTFFVSLSFSSICWVKTFGNGRTPIGKGQEIV